MKINYIAKKVLIGHSKGINWPMKKPFSLANSRSFANLVEVIS